MFVGTRDQVPRYFLGLASAESVARALERRYPWLYEARAGAQLRLYDPAIRGQLHEVWDLIQGSNGAIGDDHQVQGFKKIVLALVSPIDLSIQGWVHKFVGRFLANPVVRRERKDPSSDKDWFQVSPLPDHMQLHGQLYDDPNGKYEEHARLIENERDLVDLIGEDLHREQVTNKEGLNNEALKDEVLRKRGSFVALTDAEGRFDRLINRSALLEAVAAGK